jgi:cytochrome c-type biogenesis protein CcmE
MARSTSVPAVPVVDRTANKNIKFIIGGVLLLLAVVYLIFTGVQSTAAYFLTVDEMYAKGAAIENRIIRVSGKVDETTIDFNNRELILAFEITSESGQRLPVLFNGPKPDQMRQGADAILEGKYDGHTFTADTLLLKCPSRYEEGVVEEVQLDAVR